MTVNPWNTRKVPAPRLLVVVIMCRIARCRDSECPVELAMRVLMREMIEGAAIATVKASRAPKGAAGDQRFS